MYLILKFGATWIEPAHIKYLKQDQVHSEQLINVYYLITVKCKNHWGQQAIILSNYCKHIYILMGFLKIMIEMNFLGRNSFLTALYSWELCLLISLILLVKLSQFNPPYSHLSS